MQKAPKARGQTRLAQGQQIEPLQAQPGFFVAGAPPQREEKGRPQAGFFALHQTGCLLKSYPPRPPTLPAKKALERGSIFLFGWAVRFPGRDAVAQLGSAIRLRNSVQMYSLLWMKTAYLGRLQLFSCVSSLDLLLLLEAFNQLLGEGAIFLTGAGARGILDHRFAGHRAFSQASVQSDDGLQQMPSKVLL